MENRKLSSKLIKENLEKFKDDDIVLISDLDEIPSVEKFYF